MLELASMIGTWDLGAYVNRPLCPNLTNMWRLSYQVGVATMFSKVLQRLASLEQE